MMIELCTRKRMVLAIIVLFSLTVITLIVEGMWSNNHTIGELNSEEETKCGTESVKIVEDCRPCSSFELKSLEKICEKTGYREKFRCGDGGKDTESFKRSCKVDPWIEERKFWILELITCAIGFGTYGLVRYRQNNLDRTLMEKVNRQIAA
ncbi:hypothetical protein ACF0H5_012714 [Mactra antiquata]